MGRYAAFVQRLGWGGPRTVGYGRPRYVGHVSASTAADARQAARERLSIVIRSCDRVVVKRDGGRRQWYGVRGAGAPAGVGML